MYELKIKDNNGIWRTADLGSEVPAMNYSANDITELKTRRGVGSQAIRIPITPINTKIFEHSDEFDVVTHFPYNYHDCRLYKDGYTLAGKGSILRLIRVSDVFECQIGTGIMDFFEMIKNKDFASLDLGRADLPNYNGSWGAGNIQYPIALYVQRLSYATQKEFGRVFPCVKLEYVINELVKQNGYTLEHNINEFDQFLSICSITADEDSVKDIPYDRATSNHESRNRNSIYFPIIIRNNELNHLKTNSGSGESENPIWVEYTMPCDGELTVTTHLGANYGNEIGGSFLHGSFRTRISNMSDGSTIVHQGTTIDPSDSFKLSEGDRIRVSFSKESNPSEIYYTIDAYAEFKITSATTVPPSGTLPISKNLGFKTQLDAFKAFVQTYGLIVDVDNVRKVVKAYTLDKLYENKSKAIDWSSKLHDKKNTFSFAIGNYGQKNNIKFKKNDTDDFTDVGIFSVNDTTLTQEKDLFEIGFESGFDKSFTIQEGNIRPEHLSAACIPLVEQIVNDDKTVSYKFKGAKLPHIVNINGKTIPTPSGIWEFISTANHIPMQSFVDKYYYHLYHDILDRSRIIEAYFDLSSEDIENFSQFVPVKIDAHGAYFYVNKISNYGAQALTKCELIKI